jgi:hypothetical protein
MKKGLNYLNTHSVCIVDAKVVKVVKFYKFVKVVKFYKFVKVVKVLQSKEVPHAPLSCLGTLPCLNSILF